MAYQYSIAFYEEDSQIHLVEGIANAGLVQNDSFDYYYIDLGQNRESTYEITLTPKLGNPDLVLSMNRDNMFPDKDLYDLISNELLSTDSILITSEMIKAFEYKA